MRQRVVELPLARKQRFMRQYQLPVADAETFVNDVPLGRYYESIVAPTTEPQVRGANWVINNLRAKLAETQTALADLKFPATAIPELVGLVESGQISGKTAQEVFAEMFANLANRRPKW